MNELRASLLIAVFSAFGTAGVAHAAPDDVKRAEQLFDEAKALMQTQNYAEACAKLEDSERLDPQLGTQLHLGYCYEKSGRLARAYQSYQIAADLAAKRNASGVSEPREQLARERLANLATQVATVELRPSDRRPGFELAIDGSVIEPSRWSALVLEPGAHSLRASAQGFEDWRQDFTAAAASHQILVVSALTPLARHPEVVAAPELVSAGSSEAPPARSSPANVQRIAGYITLGVGVASVGLGSVFGLMRNAKVSELDEYCDFDAGSCAITRGDAAARARITSLHDHAQTYATIANVGLVVGGLAVAGGLVLILTSRSDETAALTLAATPGGFLLTARAHGM